VKQLSSLVPIFQEGLRELLPVILFLAISFRMQHFKRLSLIFSNAAKCDFVAQAFLKGCFIGFVHSMMLPA